MFLFDDFEISKIVVIITGIFTEVNECFMRLFVTNFTAFEPSLCIFCDKEFEKNSIVVVLNDLADQ